MSAGLLIIDAAGITALNLMLELDFIFLESFKSNLKTFALTYE